MYNKSLKIVRHSLAAPQHVQPRRGLTRKFFICARTCTHHFQTALNMSAVPWSTDINFSSALLLHSCTTILLKESLNISEVLRRLIKRYVNLLLWPMQSRTARFWIETSAVLDAYTSVYSRDDNGELAELYFTNTGFILLVVSLASSLAMNLLLPPLALNLMVALTFGFTFMASLFVCRSKYTLPIAALRRAGRFIWSDTPFVNFFTLLYIATVLRGQATLRLQDYVTFRSIAVLELIFMKAKLAASDPNTQITLMRRLIESERIVISAVPFPLLHLMLSFANMSCFRNLPTNVRKKRYPWSNEIASRHLPPHKDYLSCYVKHP